MKRRSLVLASIATLASPEAIAVPSSFELVYIGGRDCPWCVKWVKEQKPRLLASPLYRKLRYVEIETAKMRDSYDARNWPQHLVTVLYNLPVKGVTPRFLIVKDGHVYANETGGGYRANILPLLHHFTGTA
jgi:hypothetical protein